MSNLSFHSAVFQESWCTAQLLPVTHWPARIAPTGEAFENQSLWTSQHILFFNLSARWLVVFGQFLNPLFLAFHGLPREEGVLRPYSLP